MGGEATPMDEDTMQPSGAAASSAAASEASNDEQGEKECNICYEPVETFRGRLDSCDHWFCFECINQWSQQSTQCPACKRRFKKLFKHDMMNHTETAHRLPKRNFDASRMDESFFEGAAAAAQGEDNVWWEGGDEPDLLLGMIGSGYLGQRDPQEHDVWVRRRARERQQRAARRAQGRGEDIPAQPESARGRRRGAAAISDEESSASESESSSSEEEEEVQRPQPAQRPRRQQRNNGVIQRLRRAIERRQEASEAERVQEVEAPASVPEAGARSGTQVLPDGTVIQFHAGHPESESAMPAPLPIRRAPVEPPGPVRSALPIRNNALTRLRAQRESASAQPDPLASSWAALQRGLQDVRARAQQQNQQAEPGQPMRHTVDSRLVAMAEAESRKRPREGDRGAGGLRKQLRVEQPEHEIVVPYEHQVLKWEECYEAYLKKRIREAVLRSRGHQPRPSSSRGPQTPRTSSYSTFQRPQPPQPTQQQTQRRPSYSNPSPRSSLQAQATTSPLSQRQLPHPIIPSTQLAPRGHHVGTPPQPHAASRQQADNITPPVAHPRPAPVAAKEPDESFTDILRRLASRAEPQPTQQQQRETNNVATNGGESPAAPSTRKLSVEQMLKLCKGGS